MEALVSTEQAKIEVGQLWRHKKVDHVYEVIDTGARVQMATDPVGRHFETWFFIAYRLEGTERPIYFRPVNEFLDGRFERVQRLSTREEVQQRHVIETHAVTADHLTYEERHLLRRLRVHARDDVDTRAHRALVNLGLAMRDQEGRLHLTQTGAALDLPREPGAYQVEA